MSVSPETRPSLIVRLKDRADDEAWFEFTEIYRPVILRLASRRGMQHADAENSYDKTVYLLDSSPIFETPSHDAPQHDAEISWESSKSACALD